MTIPRLFLVGDRVGTHLFGSKHIREGVVTRVTRTGVWVKLDGWDRSKRFGHNSDLFRMADRAEAEPRYADPQPNDGPARLALLFPGLGSRKII